MKTAYTTEQILENEVGWLFYDAALKCWKSIYTHLSGNSVLDIGCASGVGMGLIKLFNPLLRVEGMEGADAGRKMWEQRGITVTVGDICNLPYAGASFDTVYTSHVLEHCTDPNRVIEESIRVARKRIIHVVPDGDVNAKNFGSPHLHVFNRKNYKELFDGFDGLSLVSYRAILDEHLNSLIAVYDVHRN